MSVCGRDCVPRDTRGPQNAPSGHRQTSEKMQTADLGVTESGHSKKSVTQKKEPQLIAQDGDEKPSHLAKPPRAQQAPQGSSAGGGGRVCCHQGCVSHACPSLRANQMLGGLCFCCPGDVGGQGWSFLLPVPLWQEGHASPLEPPSPSTALQSAETKVSRALCRDIAGRGRRNVPSLPGRCQQRVGSPRAAPPQGREDIKTHGRQSLLLLSRSA